MFEVTSPNKIKAYIQYPHTIGEYVQIDAITGSPCNLEHRTGLAAFIWLVTLPDQPPQTLYNCRTNLPEAFPVEDVELGIIEQINVGSPQIRSWLLPNTAGEIICLNCPASIACTCLAGQCRRRYALQPRGIGRHWAWCKAAGEIWLSLYDGIYSWSGASLLKGPRRSIQCFKEFRSDHILRFYWIDSDELVYRSASGNHVFRQQRDQVGLCGYDRKLPHASLQSDPRQVVDRRLTRPISGLLEPITAQYLEPDTGDYLIAKAVGSGPVAYLYLADNGYSDGWVNTNTDGSPINFAANGASYTAGQPALNKQFTDVVPEIYKTGQVSTWMRITTSRPRRTRPTASR